MKNKKLLITVLMFSILLTMIFPISAFADDSTTPTTIKAGTYTWADVLTPLPTEAEDYIYGSFRIVGEVQGVSVTVDINKIYWDDARTNLACNVTSVSPAGLTSTGYKQCYHVDTGWANWGLDCKTFELLEDITVGKSPNNFVDTVGTELAFNWFINNTNYRTVHREDFFKNYGDYSLPIIDTVWTDKNTYTVAIIFADKVGDGLAYSNYHLVYGQFFYKDYIFNETSLTGSPEAYCSISTWQWYDLDTSSYEWVYNTGGTNNVICRTETYDLLWSSAPIYTDSTRDEYFFPTTPPQTEVLTQVVEIQMLAGALSEIVTILPLGLLCGIGYLALRKALTILVHLLRKA